MAGVSDCLRAGEGPLLLWLEVAVGINKGPYVGPSLAIQVTEQAVHPLAFWVLFKAFLGKWNGDEERGRTKYLELEGT